MIEPVVVYSPSTDVFYNLALEEYAVDRLCGRYQILLLWQSRAAVVIGRFQDPLRETDPALLERHGVQLGRRISGGGAVYQDAGNLNYSFIAAKSIIDKADVFGIVERALGALGIDARTSAGKDILCRGRKISGNAMAFRNSGALHHGTLLVSSDLASLHCYLTPASRPGQEHAVASRPAPVANLTEFVPGLTPDRLTAEIERQAESSGTHYRPALVNELTEPAVFKTYCEKMKSREWLFGFPPRPEYPMIQPDDLIRIAENGPRYNNMTMIEDARR